MKVKFIYGLIGVFVLLLAMKVVNNINTKRGLNKRASKDFVNNFNDMVGTKKLKEDPDAEMNALIDASGDVSDFALQMGDDKLECDFGYREENLKKLKVKAKRLGYKCRDDECSEEEKNNLKNMKSEILECIDQNELGNYE